VIGHAARAAPPYSTAMPDSLHRRTRLRAGVAAAFVGTVAVLCVSSPVFATIAAALTLAAVIADVVAQRGRVIQPRPEPGRLRVDLTRRSPP
jgi:hypothetical protein